MTSPFEPAGEQPPVHALLRILRLIKGVCGRSVAAPPSPSPPAVELHLLRDGGARSGAVPPSQPVEDEERDGGSRSGAVPPSQPEEDEERDGGARSGAIPPTHPSQPGGEHHRRLLDGEGVVHAGRIRNHRRSFYFGNCRPSLALAVAVMLFVNTMFFVSMIKYKSGPGLVMFYFAFVSFYVTLYWRRRLRVRSQYAGLRRGLGFVAIFLGAFMSLIFFNFFPVPVNNKLPTAAIATWLVLGVLGYSLYRVLVLHVEEDEAEALYWHANGSVFSPV